MKKVGKPLYLIASQALYKKKIIIKYLIFFFYKKKKQ